MNALQRSVMEAVEQARDEDRCKARCRYHLRKRNHSLIHSQGVWLVVCQTSMAAKFRSTELADVESWIRAMGAAA